MSGHNISTFSNSTHKTEDESEAYYLFLMATCGIFCNGIIILICFAKKCLRKLTSAFIIHGALLDMAKCAYCIPFAMSILTHEPPDFCQLLGGSYVVIISASVFNLVAMVCTESYIFSEEPTRNSGSFCCVIFGIAMIYSGSVILHLGPTIVGGTFDFNKVLSQCVFMYGQVPSYVVYIMWVIVTTLSILITCNYLWVLYSNINTRKKEQQLPVPEYDTADITFQDQLSQPIFYQDQYLDDAWTRVRCFIIILIAFIVTWYPMFIATLIDPKFEMSPTVYIILTYLAWSNGAVNPLVFLTTDNQFNVLRSFFKSQNDKHSVVGSDQTRSDRVACRLCRDEDDDEGARSSNCNGRLGNGRVNRSENSFCSLHHHHHHPHQAHQYHLGQTEWHV